MTPDWAIQLGCPPNRIDLISTPPGVDFADCYANRVVIRVDGIAVNFIALEHLKQNKVAAGGKQDLADVEALLEN